MIAFIGREVVISRKVGIYGRKGFMQSSLPEKSKKGLVGEQIKSIGQLDNK